MVSDDVTLTATGLARLQAASPCTWPACGTAFSITLTAMPCRASAKYWRRSPGHWSSGRGYAWTWESMPRSRRIDSRMTNVVLAVYTSAAARTPRYFLMTGPAA
jgi:hypothetical protein